MNILPHKLSARLRDSFSQNFSDTVIDYSRGSAIFCDLLLKVIENDIHSINLTSFFDENFLSIERNEEVINFNNDHKCSIINIDNLFRCFLSFYIPRVFVTLHITTFGGKRIDRDSIYQFISCLLDKSEIDSKTMKKLIKEGESHLNLLYNKCKDEDWLYNIDTVLDFIEDGLTQPTRINTIQIFNTFMKAIEPKFIEDLNDTFGKRMSLSFMLGMNEKNTDIIA